MIKQASSGFTFTKIISILASVTGCSNPIKIQFGLVFTPVSSLSWEGGGIQYRMRKYTAGRLMALLTSQHHWVLEPRYNKKLMRQLLWI